VISLLGIIPYRGTYFGLYDTLRDLNPWVKDNGFIGIFSKFMVAQITAIVAGLVAYPFDTIRRYQIVTDTSLVEAVHNIWEHGGIAGFFGGATYNILRTVVSTFALVAYDQIRNAVVKK
jgi:solute carrier family 25 (adenine nucleotide translocator) protein 4/5/6/31